MTAEYVFLNKNHLYQVLINVFATFEAHTHDKIDEEVTIKILKRRFINIMISYKISPKTKPCSLLII